MKNIIIIGLLCIFVFVIYILNVDHRMNYVSLGDSIAAGQNPYGDKQGYGYTDYIKDYLFDNDMLKEYKDYAVSGYKIDNVINDINNSSILRRDLRESHLVTISIGANDFLEDISLSNIDFSNIDYFYKKIDKVIGELNNVLKLVREYAKNDVIVVGYYNPFPILFKSNSSDIDKVFEYMDNNYLNVCNKYDIKYLSIYTLFKDNFDFLPNPFDIHPNIDGYRAISLKIIDNFLKVK